MSPKLCCLLIESLGIIPRIKSAGHLSAPRVTTKFLIFAAWRIAASLTVVGSPDSMRKRLAISSKVLSHLSANPLCCGVCVIIFSYKMAASKQYPLNCSARNSSVLSCLSFLGVPTLKINLFRLVSASLSALSVSTNFIYWSANTMLNRNPYGNSNLYSPMYVCEHPHQFLQWLVFYHFFYHGQCAHIASIFMFHQCLWCIPDIQLIFCTAKCHAAGTHLEWFSSVSVVRVPFWRLMQLFAFSKVKLCPHFWNLKRLIVDLKNSRAKKFLSSHWNSPV